MKIEEIILKSQDGKILASSREISERFEKRHGDVIEKIAKLEEEIQPTENSVRYFTPTEYEDLKGEMRKEYLLTRDGFSLVVMGFNGNKALQWKLKYIEAFNKMEQTLKDQNKSALPGTYKDALIQLLEQVERNEQLEEENKVLLPKGDYHDKVLNKDGLIATTVIAKDLGLTSAAKLNQIMFLNRIIYKNQSGTWCPYAKYEWLITDGYADYKSYEKEQATPTLKWTENGRKWIIDNYGEWNKE